VDLLPRQAGERLQALAAKLGQAATFERVFNVSAARGAGMAELRADLLARRAPTLSLHPDLIPDLLARRAPRGPWAWRR